jgi:hypothetical protein
MTQALVTKGSGAQVKLLVRHPRLELARPLPEGVVRALADDLRDAPV